MTTPTQPTETTPSLSVEGRAVPPPARGFMRALMGVTGLGLLVNLWRLFARYALGRHRSARVVVQDGHLTVHELQHTGGAQTEVAQESFPRPSVLSARLEVRYPALPLLAGMFSLGVGVVLGIIWLLDGIQGEFTPWIAAGVGVLLLGLGLDLGLTTLASSMPSQATLVLYLPGERVVRLVGCDPERAERLVRWLHKG